jgi:hypothetical protein
MAVQITGSQIKNSEIGSSKLQDNAVTTAKISDSNVTSAKIASSAITSAKIATGALNNTAFFANSVITAAKIDLTGTFNFGSGTLQAATPSNASDVATKNYVDSAVSSDIYWKEPCRVATIENIDLSSAPASIDGVTLANDDRVLVKDQTTQSQNGVYVFAGSGSAMSRSSDCDSAAELNGAAVFVKEGSTSADQGFTQTGEIVTLGTNNVVWVQFTGLGQITAGDGLSKSGNTLSVDVGDGMSTSGGQLVVSNGAALDFNAGDLDVQVDDSSIEVNGSNQLQVKANGITTSMIGTNQVTGNEIAGLTVGTANLADSSVTSAKLGASSVSAVKIASNAVTSDKIQSNAVTESKIATSVAGDGLSGGNGSALAVQVDDTGIEIASNTLQLKNLGVSTAKIQDSAITTAKILDLNITGGKLANNVAGAGLRKDPSNNLEVNCGDGLDFNGDELEVQLGQGLGFAPDGVIEPEVDDATIEIDGVSNEIQVKDLGITSGKLADGSVQTAKIGDDQVTFAKVGWRMYQELSTISGSSTTTIDLARALDPNAVNGVMVYKNGLAMLNQTALSGTAANSDEFSVSADGGAGSVGRLTFGAALADSDSILIWYLT